MALAAVGTCCALVLGITTAVADTASFRDRKDDAPAAFDVWRVSVANAKRIIVKTRYDNLRSDKPGGVNVYFDTRAGDRGPEYVAGGPVGTDGDWQVLRIENWSAAGAQYVVCGVRMRISYGRDVVTFNMSRKCLSRPGRIRVAVVSSGRADKDWAPRFHRFHSWVPR
jgi:hypothetical protein